jgi:hypothetical protein
VLCFVTIASMANGKKTQSLPGLMITRIVAFTAAKAKRVKRDPKLQTLLYAAFFVAVVGIIVVFLIGSLLNHSLPLNVAPKPI